MDASLNRQVQLLSCEGKTTAVDCTTRKTMSNGD